MSVSACPQDADPLCYKGKLRIGTGFALLRASHILQAKVSVRSFVGAFGFTRSFCGEAASVPPSLPCTPRVLRRRLHRPPPQRAAATWGALLLPCVASFPPRSPHSH